eukprot:CAMPEP_0115850834 /NCGR_PEP_ID=MMETSP0287-20121206/12169_1 /TAXON_ID=412157 /ORGANISM="Chrysochromulina rotalis, Strain UIO044" /LENGTH=188 /DNA_ID=CAMNT_0003304845 /DNA_START=34 /DNA_END=600 /DNA_ORIENTATION=-
MAHMEALMAKPEASGQILSYCLIGKATGVKDAITKDPQLINSRAKKRGYSPLQAATAAESPLETIQVLLDAGADVKHVDMMQLTALHTAADKPNPEAMLKLLEHPDAKSMLEMADEDGCTPMHYAACAGHIEVITALLKLGAQAEVENLAGMTPAKLAAEYEHPEAAELITNGLPQVAPAEGEGGDGE